MPDRNASDETDFDRRGVLRQVFESIIILGISVTLFRTFAAEGYLISTGSMAPSLLGYHKRVECPTCHYTFPRGVPVEDSPATLNANVHADPEQVDFLTVDDFASARGEFCSCPNCGRHEISLAAFPKNEGDQLLVHKNVFDVRDPHRWEVVVFRNPDDPAQPYVKRVVGLPGETIRLLGGDVYAAGQLQRKPLSAQQGVRIPVDDHAFQPDESDPNWRPRWISTRKDSRWSTSPGRMVFRPDDETATALDWIQFRNWITDGGRHTTEVPLLKRAIELSAGANGLVSFDASRRRLIAQGAMPAELCDELLAINDDVETEKAIRDLFERSHVAPITDTYGYNRDDAAAKDFPVHDLMVEFQLEPSDEGTLVVEMSDDQHTFVCQFQRSENRVSLLVDRETRPIREAALPKPKDEKERKPLTIEMSVMDRQVLIAVDGQVLFEPLMYAASKESRPSTRSPVRLGASGGDVSIRDLRLYRDVYYTPKHESETREFVLGPSEFLVLGDNSPVSVDSRAWDHPAIDRSTLIGKPFIVHLPSRQAKIDLLGESRYIRLPDFSRVRYIR